MKEILTIQAGSFANYVGAHLTNLQREHQHHHHDDEDQDGMMDERLHHHASFHQVDEGLRPRTIIFDVEQELSTFKAKGCGGRQEEEAVMDTSDDLSREKTSVNWKGDVDIHYINGATKPGKNKKGNKPSPEPSFSEPRRWSDIYRAHLTSRNYVVVDDCGGGGQEIGWTEDRGGDHLRRLMEECDAVQGLHLLLDLSKGALPFGIGGVEEFAEEAGGGAVACFCFRTPSSEEKASMIDTALGLKNLLDAGALIIPLDTSPVTCRGPASSSPLPMLFTDSSFYRTSLVHAVALDVMSGVYAGGLSNARCHMREWVHGIRSGGNSLASLDIALPFPPTTGSSQANLDTQQLENLLRPIFDERSPQTLKTDSGVTSYLWSLCPPSSPLLPKKTPATPIPQRRYSGLVSLCGLPLDASSVLTTLNDNLKYYPWFQPQLNYAARPSLPIQRWPFPQLFLGQNECTDIGCMTMVGCSSSVVPFLQDVSQTFERRSPAIRAHLGHHAGLLEEDLVEVDDVLSDLINDYMTERNGRMSLA